MDNFIPTNTLSSLGFDVFKSDYIEDPMIDTNKLATLDFEESYFNTAINFIKENNEMYTNSKLELYKCLREAQNTTVVLESFSDFFVKVKEIIKKFLNFLKSLFERFLTTLNRLIGSEEYLKKHKKDFASFKSSDDFEFDGFNYTFSPMVPNPNAALSYNNSLFDKLYVDDRLNLDINNIKAAGSAIVLEKDCSEFRAKVIGKEGKSIDASDFVEELFRVFRDDCYDTEKIEVNSSYVNEAVKRFFDYNEVKKQINKESKAVNDAYKDVEKQVENIVKRNGDLNAKAILDRMPGGITSIEVQDGIKTSNDLVGYTMPGEIMSQLDIYVKLKVDQIQEYSNIHALAFAAKLDALKECNKQDKVVLYTALSRIQRTESKREAN